jgi:hypothetical protein
MLDTSLDSGQVEEHLLSRMVDVVFMMALLFQALDGFFKQFQGVWK